MFNRKPQTTTFAQRLEANRKRYYRKQRIANLLETVGEVMIGLALIICTFLSIIILGQMFAI